ncbi:isocitrate lyase/PEP mutase family protein [Pseudarthrobacter phenanthrenivorans]|uniref:isocitrate lyase/PEP mutase family protein n=1 Tax=Pseudarthrobacter phenanthrenivorans TaxID=361575 RepID=UPI00344B9CF1
MNTSKKATRLREFFTSPRTEIFPLGVLPIHAQMAEAAGFGAFQISGGFSSWWLNGMPDAGMMTRTEVLDNARRVVQSVDIPVYCDADTGFGGVQNVAQTVKDFIHAGVAGIHIEDQVEPKKAGGAAGIAVVSDEEAIGRFNAACEARDRLDKDFVITARTDAYAAPGGDVEEVLRRGQLYLEKTGVDVIFYEGIRSWEESRYLLENTDGTAYVIASRHAGPVPPIAQLSEWGQAVHMFTFVLPGVQEVWKMLLEVKESGEMASHSKYVEELFAREGTEAYVGFGDRFVKPSYEQVRELEERFLPASQQRDYVNSIFD